MVHRVNKAICTMQEKYVKFSRGKVSVSGLSRGNRVRNTIIAEHFTNNYKKKTDLLKKYQCVTFIVHKYEEIQPKTIKDKKNILVYI